MCSNTANAASRHRRASSRDPRALWMPLILTKVKPTDSCHAHFVGHRDKEQLSPPHHAGTKTEKKQTDNKEQPTTKQNKKQKQKTKTKNKKQQKATKKQSNIATSQQSKETRKHNESIQTHVRFAQCSFLDRQTVLQAAQRFVVTPVVAVDLRHAIQHFVQGLLRFGKCNEICHPAQTTHTDTPQKGTQ